jgi:pimeloyl-ACP methyl ester carboxylesterase
VSVLSESLVKSSQRKETSNAIRYSWKRHRARYLMVKDGPHCITWTHADEVNAELLSFLGEKAGKSQKVA